MTKQEFRAKLISNATKAEIALLYEMANDKVLRGKYKYQHIFDPYIVDFFFPRYKLVVELDGSAHDYSSEYDQRRTNALKKRYGIKNIIRFTNKEMFQEKRTVLNSIKQFILPKRKLIYCQYGVNPKSINRRHGAISVRKTVS